MWSCLAVIKEDGVGLHNCDRIGSLVCDTSCYILALLSRVNILLGNYCYNHQINCISRTRSEE